MSIRIWCRSIEVRFERAVVLPEVAWQPATGSVVSDLATLHDATSSPINIISWRSRANTARHGGHRAVGPRSAALI